MPRCMTSTSPEARSARRYFARRPSAVTVRPAGARRSARGSGKRRSGRRCSTSSMARADHGRLEAAADGLDFGQFGHQPVSLVPAAHIALYATASAMHRAAKDNRQRMAGCPDETTHFGFTTVPLGEKQGRVNDVFRSVARRYDLMNDLMSAGLHRAWKDASSRRLRPPRKPRLPPPRRGRRHRRRRLPHARCGRAATHVTVLDINGDMLAVGRERAGARYDGRIDFVEANAEALPLRGRDVRRLHDRLRHPQRAAHRGGARGGAPRAQAAAAASCASNSPRSTCRASTRSTTPIRSTSSRASAASSPGDAESYRYLVESIRRFPPPRRLRAHDRGGGLRARDAPARSPAASSPSIPAGRSDVIGGIVHLARNLRAGFVLAREGALALVDPSVAAAVRRASRCASRARSSGRAPATAPRGCRRR